MPEPSSDRERRVDEAIAWYYRQAESGSPPDPDAFLARFPDVRPDLQSFLADKAVFEHAAGPAVPDATITVDAGGGAPTSAPLGRVRYFGDYELLEEVARGGMGVVYKARQVSLNRVVALKMILSGQLASAADIRRFRQEAEAAANLDHPNILPIYEVGEHDGRQYFSMKLVEGSSLAKRLQSPRPYGRGLSGDVQLLVTVARAVHFAHQRGILHRDLKPSNILLDPDGTPYVTDFGLAKKVEGDAGLTQSGALVGTPSYMAPEQARAEKQLSTGVDVYSLGAILYEVLVGRPPFRGTGVMDTVLQVLNREPDDPRAVNLNVNRDLAVIALKCLAKEPAKRYESAAALASDLERWQRGEPILARPASFRERAFKWVRRNPVPAVFTAAILVLLLGGLTAVTRLYFRSEHYRQDAEAERDAARGRLARQYAEKAGAAADQGDPFLGLPWLVEALKTTDGRPEADLHRLHLGMLLKQAPGLVHYEPTATCVALHPDGKRIAIGSKVGVELLPLGGDQPLVPLIKFTGPTTLAFSPDGKRLLVAGGVGGAGTGPWQTTTVRIFDVDTGHPLTPEAKVGRPKDGATAVRFAAGGSVVLAEWQGHVNRHVAHVEVFLYDVATLAPIGQPWIAATPERMKGEYVKIDPGTLRALTPCVRRSKDQEEFDGRVQVWDLRTGRPFFDPIQPTTDEWESGLELAPGGDRFAMLAAGDKTVRVYDATTGKTVGNPLVHPEPVSRMTYRADGKVLATLTRDGQLRTWDPATGQPVGPDFTRISDDHWWNLSYAPDGRTLHVHGNQGTAACDADTGETLLRVEYKDAPFGTAFSPDGVHAASATYEGVHVWQRAGGRVLPFLPHGSSVAVAFSPEGRFLATSGNGVRVWDLAAAQPPARPLLPPTPVPARTWELNPPADRVVRLDADGAVQVFDTRTGEPVGQGFRPPGDWLSAEVSPDGKLILTVGWAEGRPTAPTAAELAGRMSGGRDYLWKTPRDVGVWDAATGRAVVVPLRHRSVARVFVGPDGKSLLVIGHVSDYTGKKDFADGDRVTEFSKWDLETGDLRLPVVRQPDHLEPVSLTPDGRKLLMLVPADGGKSVHAQLWDVDAVMPDGRLFGPPGGRVKQAVVSPDGTRVLTVSDDDDAQVWDVTTGQVVAGPFRHTSTRVGQTAGLAMAAFSPDGRRVVTGTTGSGSPGEARVWDVASGRPVTPVLRFPVGARFVGFSPDGRLLVAAGGGREAWEVRAWEADTGMPVSPPLRVAAQLSWEAVNGRGDFDDRPRFTPDGRRLLFPSKGGVSVVDLIPEARPAAELESVARILAGHEVDAAGGFQPLSEQAATEARDHWRRLHPAPRVGPAPGYRVDLIRSAIDQKGWRTADRLLGDYLRDHPDATWAWAARATAREQLGRPADAKAAWDEVIRRADGPTARRQRAEVLARMEKYAEAVPDFAAAWAATGRPGDGARLALCQWAAGDRAAYRRTCDQLGDRRDEFPRDTAGLTLTALACGLDPDGADLVRPFVPLLEGLMSVASDTDMLRPLALGYIRIGMPGKAIPPLADLSAGNDYYSRHWQVLVLALPKTGSHLGLTGLWRAALTRVIDHWYEREEDALDWTERVILPELRAQGRR